MEKVFKMAIHSMTVRNLMKVWKTETGPLQGGRAWSRGQKSELFEILQNIENFQQKWGKKICQAKLKKKQKFLKILVFENYR